MKFLITRTDHSRKDEKPCDGAYLDSEKGYDKNIKYWFIDINTLEDLLLLVKNVEEEVIISENIDGNYSLEIYDNWRE